MRAAVIANASEGILVQELQIPELRPGTALVRLKAAALNRRDVWISVGQYAKIQYPVVPGSDGAGQVEAVGNEADKHWVGKDVILNPNIEWGESEAAQSASYSILGMPSQGTLAEYIVVAVDRLHLKPEHLSYEEAAALPLAGLTAYRAVVRQGQVQGGQNVLVSGIGGGVATLALQFARALSATVYVSSTSSDKLRIAQSLGAADGVHTADGSWLQQWIASKRDLHAVIDGLGGSYVNDFLQILSPGGRLVSYGATLGAASNVEVRRMFWKQLQWIGSTMGSDADFAAMVGFVSDHRILPVVDSTFALSEVGEAFRRMSTSQQLGKIVVVL